MSCKLAEQIEKEAKMQIEQWERALNAQYKGKDAVFLRGKYKGRKGKIMAVCIDDSGTVIMCVRPYRLAGGPPEDLLWGHPDARSYWRLEEIKIED